MFGGIDLRTVAILSSVSTLIASTNTPTELPTGTNYTVIPESNSVPSSSPSEGLTTAEFIGTIAGLFAVCILCIGVAVLVPHRRRKVQGAGNTVAQASKPERKKYAPLFHV